MSTQSNVSLGEESIYHLNKSNISSFGSAHKELQDLLDNSFKNAENLFLEVVNTKLWSGKKRDEFVSFFHIILQYHGWVAGKSVPSYANLPSTLPSDANCCLEELQNAFKMLYEIMGEFDSASSSYKDLESIE